MSVPESGDIWASLPVPALILDAQDLISALNPAAEACFNTSARAIVASQAGAFLKLDPPLAESAARVRSGQSALFLNHVEIAAGGRAAQLCNMQIAPLGDRVGPVLVLIQPREVADLLGRADERSASTGAAIGMAEMLAHEIKNPLAGITGAAQLLAMTLRGDDLEMTDLIVAESRRIVALLEQVERFGNLAPPARRAVNIHDILDRARKSAALGIAAKMAFVEDYDPSLPPTWGDGDQLLQVFQNLLKNAAEAAGDGGGRITLRSFYEHRLRLRRPDGAAGAVPLQVEIMDDGRGLPPGISAHVFEPFVSGRENGTGLGLALAARIIAAHDGMIGVSSVPGRTVFRVSLPVASSGRAAR